MGFDERIAQLERLREAIEKLAPRGGNFQLEQPYRGWVKHLTVDILKGQEWQKWAAEQKGKKGGETVGEG